MKNHNHVNEAKSISGRARFWLPVSVFAIAIGFFLFFEHRAHIPGNFTFIVLFLLLCGGMHFFMHGGHGHGSHGQNDHSGHDPSKAPSTKTNMSEDPEQTSNRGDDQ